MNVDITASIALTAEAVLLPVIAILGSGLQGAQRLRALGVAGAWLALVAGLAAQGLFSAGRFGTPLIGAAAAVPVLAVVLLRNRSATLRVLLSSIPLALLIVLHSGRLLGVEFLLLRSAGRLPATFAHAAGWGDILAATASLPLAYAVFRQIRGWRLLTLAWNVFGVADLIVAVTLGAGSAAGSPVRFLYESPSTALMGTLPWVLIPGYLVPIYLILHTAIFILLANSATLALGGTHGACDRRYRYFSRTHDRAGL